VVHLLKTVTDWDFLYAHPAEVGVVCNLPNPKRTLPAEVGVVCNPNPNLTLPAEVGVVCNPSSNLTLPAKVGGVLVLTLKHTSKNQSYSRCLTCTYIESYKQEPVLFSLFDLYNSFKYAPKDIIFHSHFAVGCEASMCAIQISILLGLSGAL
jgi:hypothetical protein